MNWKAQITPTSPTWHGIEGYVAERCAELTSVCVAPESSDTKIRQAQAGILELQRLRAIPSMLQAETQIRGQMSARKEY